MQNDRTYRKEEIIPEENGCPVFGFAGWSGSGKTTLIEKLIPLLKNAGYGIGVVKHDVHGIKTGPGTAKEESTDIPGTDSWRFHRAGADVVILCGPGGPGLEEAIQTAEQELRGNTLALILAEGFKKAAIPRIGLARRAAGIELTEPADRFLATVTDFPQEEVSGKTFRHDQTAELAEFILSRTASRKASGEALNDLKNKACL